MELFKKLLLDNKRYALAFTTKVGIGNSNDNSLLIPRLDSNNLPISSNISFNH